MSKQLDAIIFAKDGNMKILEEQLSAIEEANDALEQYSQCANLHVCAGFEIVPIHVSETCQNISGHVKCSWMVIRRTCPFFATCN